MKYHIQRVAVLGAGTMGARIAAHLANAGIPVFLLDIVPPELTAAEKSRGLTLQSAEVRNRFARAGVDAALKSRPAAFFTAETAKRIQIGNFEDNLDWCAQVDWIVEVVAENLEIKRALLEKVEHHRKPDTLVSTNTSGLPVNRIADGRSEDFRRHWAGTHFFNPPRYMKLVEVIPGIDTLSEVVEGLSNFCDVVLGKGVVIAKDTPNFIANRIGTFSVMNSLRLMAELGMSIEEVDACTGPALGWPKSATFRTADIVGLDVLVHVVRNIYDNVPNDESRETYRIPPLIDEMIKRGWLGEKSGRGFYMRVKKDGESEILTLDPATMEYRPRQKARFASIELGRTIDDTRDRLRAILGPVIAGQPGDKAQKFLWGLLSRACLYAARRVPEIADHIVDIDRAMRWGFAQEMGPFEVWDTLGVEDVANKLTQEGESLPPIVTKLLASGNKSFYRSERGKLSCFDLASSNYKSASEPPGLILLSSLKQAGAVVEKNSGATLVDLGDGVVCCEFHTKMNALGGDIVAMLHAGVKRLQSDFDAMVVANQAANFSAGANLMLLLIAAQEEEWDEINLAVRQFQGATMALKYAPRPVVVAPQGLAIGGGCEIGLHAARIHAASEAYIGLVETGVGLIPAGGGSKEMIIRSNEHAAGAEDLDLFHAMKPIFENIAMARVGTSAEESRGLGYLRPGDLVSLNRDRLVADAKATALALVREGWKPLAASAVDGAAYPGIRVLGEQLEAGAKLAIHMMSRGAYISEYDAHVARKLAHVLAGGALSAPQFVSEQYLLDLEREAFVSLCGERKTQERIAHTLKTGKPLRN
ncbi:MAG TPA: 3-hydroxyacyl-CoA dehydrogenase/enoyl-CoA hydratase family protein [Candidatus Acidoferrales bacterium]|jgi:3-hydroxyacyl-CoA dehydrogenase|nr:3-hydroxyacyl-CoA dehydrogenase/enoyl-CoA hydratase family protein [Candidatus Acidoferrales bacterium]